MMSVLPEQGCNFILMSKHIGGGACEPLKAYQESPPPGFLCLRPMNPTRTLADENAADKGKRLAGEVQ